jgi:hypothetical protein
MYVEYQLCMLSINYVCWVSIMYVEYQLCMLSTSVKGGSIKLYLHIQRYYQYTVT